MLPHRFTMKITEHKTMQITGSVHPHGQRDQTTGPFDLRIGMAAQPAVLHGKDPKTVLLCLEQPNEEKDNFTLLKVLYLRTGTRKPSFVAGCTFHNARQYRRGGTIAVRIKKRLCLSFPSPLPIGRYTGTCMYDEDRGSFVLFTLQAMTLVKEPEPVKPKTIITPGDPEYANTLRDAKRKLHGADGVDRGGTDAGGLRHGQLPDGLPPGSRRKIVG